MTESQDQFHIWIDADACPVAIKEILFRASKRLKIPMTLVANQHIRTPPTPWIKSMRVSAGFDEADNKITELCNKGDLVITADIPLAADVIAKEAFALNPRGDFYTEDNIRERLSVRNFLDGLRSSGVETGGPRALNATDNQKFANQLDRFLAQRHQ